MKKFRNVLLNTLPIPIISFLRRIRDSLSLDQWSTRSWSQEDEDLLLDRILKKKDEGFYIDVGAHR